MIDFNFILKTHKQNKDINLGEDLSIEQVNEKIKLILKGVAYKYNYYIELRESFLIQYSISKNNIYKSIYENLFYILSNFNIENTFNDNENSFIDAYRYCLHARNRKLFTPNKIYISPKILCLTDSIFFFKSKGLNNVYEHGKVNQNKIIEIESIINKKFDRIGFDALPIIFTMIPKLFNTKFYFFETESKSQIYPWGYILNKAIKFTYPLSLAKHIKENRIKSALDFCKHYISLYQLQNYEFSQFQYTHSSPFSILKIIDKHVVGDQLLKIEQYDPKSIFDYLEFINFKFNLIEFNLTLELASFILNKPHNEIIDITNDVKIIYQKYPEDVSYKISNLITHYSINNDFNTIHDLDKSDYKKKPFISINNRLFFLNHSFFFIGFYYVFLELLFQINVKSDDQGLILEEFAEHSLKSTHSQFLSNSKYNVSAQQRSLLDINCQSLEIDLLIQNKQSVALFEIKNRVLTSQSKGGNGYNILNDLSESLIKSQMQLNRHKRYLLKFNEIKFIDNQKFALDNRTIYKISVSSLDYQSLHYPLIAQNLLRSLPHFSLSLTNDPITDKLVKNINKKIIEFSNEILNPETENEILDPLGLHNSYFINIFHFLFLIERARTKGTNFIEELTLYHNTILNQLDFYYCYFYKDKKFNN
ncbi:hypothetical protein [Acinetobacter modestus]|uniref:hypothetical protein n=1 Tax=Acinetobacter modestus TaxID=1776740 RepID=UPI00301A1DE7